jgi:NitT/TauT family transport system substrate-binding protein
VRRNDLLRALGRGAAFAPFAGVAFGAVARAQTLASVRVGVAEGDDATPTLYAQKTGIFKKYGLDVTIQPMTSGAAGLAALAGGSVDITGTSLLPFFSARNAGLPLQIVAPLAVSSPESVYAALLVKKEIPYKSGRDLNGKTIASPALKDLNWLATMAWIDANGGDSTTVKAVELTSSAIPAAIDEGRVDAATVTTPRYVQALHLHDVRILGKPYEAIGKHYLFAAFVAQADYATKNPDVVANFGRAIRDATAFTNTHHADTLDLYAAFAHIDPKDIVDAPRSVSAEYVDVKDLQPLIAVATKYALMKPVDPQTMLSPAILKPGA